MITGASRGLGMHLAHSFWNEGWDIVLVARNRNTLSQVVANLCKRPDQSASIYNCDLSKPKDVGKLVTKLLRLKRLDVLVNNAAIHGPIGPLIHNDLTLWKEALQVNLISPVVLCHSLIPLIGLSGGGSIINISGGGATGPRPNFTAYASAKAALVRFSETLAQEVASQNIRVNCISPGVMKTNLLEEVIASGVDASGVQEFDIAQKFFTKGDSSFSNVADLALFLASNESKGISGKLISAIWDKWLEWPNHLDDLLKSDVFTLRRIAGRDRKMDWGDV